MSNHIAFQPCPACLLKCGDDPGKRAGFLCSTCLNNALAIKQRDEALRTWAQRLLAIDALCGELAEQVIEYLENDYDEQRKKG